MFIELDQRIGGGDGKKAIGVGEGQLAGRRDGKIAVPGTEWKKTFETGSRCRGNAFSAGKGMGSPQASHPKPGFFVTGGQLYGQMEDGGVVRIEGKDGDDAFGSRHTIEEDLPFQPYI